MGSTARQTQEQQTATLRAPLSLAALVAASTAGVVIGTLPAGARVLRTHIFIETAFNAGTTNVLDIGPTGSPAVFLPSATVVAGATGLKTAAPTALNGVIAADIDVRAIYSQTGTVATTGQATAIVEYVCDNEG